MNNIGTLIRSVKNPEQLIQQVMNDNQIMKNPIAKNAIEMYKKKDIAGINKIAENLCKEKGINPEDAANQIKSMFGL